MESLDCLIGTVIDDRYRLTRLLGSGSFGNVFEAAEEVLGEYIARVAVKILRPKDAVEQEAVLREVRGLARFGHPHIIAYRTAGQIAAGELAGSVFLVTELAETSLEQALKQPGRIAEDEVRAMALGIAKALDFCHQSGAIHGDVKPANVFRVQGTWKLGDFGLVRAARSGTENISPNEGTCAYMAPELCDGRTSAKADVYSLGVTILEALTGEVAHRGTTREEFLHDLASHPARIPENLPSPWTDLLTRCLDRNAEGRFTAEELLRALTPTIEAAPSRGGGADTVVVSSLGHGECLSLGEALRAARPGGRIVVRPGRYREDLVLDKPVEIVGEGPVQEIVVEAVQAGCVRVKTERAAIRGITLCAASAPQYPECYTVDVPQGALVLEDCEVTSGSLACIAVHGAGTEATLRRCRIRQGRDAGLFLYDRARATVERCEIVASGYSAISVSEGAQAELRNSRIRHGQASGLYVERDGRAEAVECEIFANARAGVAVGEGGEARLLRCRIAGNGSFGVWIHEASRGTIDGCTLSGNGDGPCRLPEGCTTWSIEPAPSPAASAE